MSLTSGTRLGPYEIIAPIGAGGMGEVYRARDTKLNRDVAIKVLPAAFAQDSDRLARFTREAQTLALLNHPNIAQVFGLETTSGVVSGKTTPDVVSYAIVMELVDGDDLSKIITRGPIPLNDALPIAKQIAEALEAAHELGIVHRDLKPANIKVRADGTVKVLDFGLAKALDSARAWALAPQDGSDAAAALANLPTITSPAALTEHGLILGTAAYMSPEQAAGKTVDKRSDLWSFGVVLYEMLTGQRLFTGETVSHVMAAVLTKDPDWTTLPAETPAAVRRLLRRCLEKDRRRRIADAADVRLELDEAISPADRDGGSATTRVAQSVVPIWRRVLPWTVAAIGLGAAVVLLVMLSPWRPTPVATPRTLLAGIGADASLVTASGTAAILSPDGTMLVFVGQQADQPRLFVRKLDQLLAVPLAGTEGAHNPFFSPDGQWIAFFADQKLKKTPVTGGTAVNLCDSYMTTRGGTWADDDTIIFPTWSALRRVSASGGTPGAFGALGQGATIQVWPQTLPGGKGVLYTEHSKSLGFDAANLVVAPLAGGTGKIIIRGGYFGRYVPSGLGSPKRDEGGGHIVYMRQGALFAMRFDLGRLETIGHAVPALDGVLANQDTGAAQFAISSEGTMAYVPGTAVAGSSIDWMTRDGKTSVLRAAKADWANPQFSPDGQKLALDVSDGTQHDIWVYDWARDTMTGVTVDPAEDMGPVWTPDGRIVFASDRAKAGIFNLYWVNADGTGEVTRLTNSPNSQQAYSWHPTSKFLAFHENRGTSKSDLMILPMEGDARQRRAPGTPTVFLGTPANEIYPIFSPDGRWIAYVSDESTPGFFDVYVRPFPVADGRWKVSTTGGVFPRWSATSHELLFVRGSGNFMSAPYVVVGDSFRADKPQAWSPTGFSAISKGFTTSPYDLHPDGKRLAVAHDEGTKVQDKVVFVFNFFEYLRKIAPGNK